MMENNGTSRKKRVLIVDDDQMTRMLMRATLEKGGFEVTEAENGQVALDFFETLQPDVILLDVMMPVIDGFETCRAIRELPSGEYTPILMITGLDDIASINSSFEAGATDFITKPIVWPVLNYRVKYMLRSSEAFYDVIDKQRQIHELAFYDHLTGLANRTMFNHALEMALADSAVDEHQLAVLFLDLDRFKRINDTLGHYVGDMLLKKVADRINACIRATDSFSRISGKISKSYISRLGGDEFTIMLPELKDPEDAGRVAKRINDALQAPFDIEGNEIYISASIGISVFPLDGTEADVIMKHADVAMYYAKEKGKNNFQFYKKSLNAKALERLELENDIRKAVAHGEMTLYYQPQICMREGKIAGAEVLARWHHHKQGPVSPEVFIPAIEELGLIVPFTDWVIEETVKQQAAWRNDGLPMKRLALNISSKQFGEQMLPKKISASLNEIGIGAEFLELELTESVLAEQSEETIRILNELKTLGLSISVDDFGTGYSTLIYLKTFPVDTIKIDRFFVKDIHQNPQDAAIVKSIIAMAKSLGKTVVGEGIETREQFMMLRDMGCDVGQGYFFSPAVSGDEFAKLAEQGASFQ